MDPFSKYLPDLTDRMQTIVASRYTQRQSPTLVYHMLEYHLGWRDSLLEPAQVESGKRLRPIMLLLCCEAFGGDWQNALNAAAAVEMLHNFTLIHDDIEDRDEIRRGRRTLWKIWGIPQAINAGDALFSLSYQALLSSALPPATILKMSRRFTETILHLTEGQCEDMAFETTTEVSEQRYLAMIGGKTAALLGLVCELGALAAGASDQDSAFVQQFGMHLGYAFQMQDDVLGIWGDPAITGKPVGSDLLKHKKTLPILHGMDHSLAFKAILSKPNPSVADIKTALQLLEASESQTYTQEKARHYLQRALTALDNSNASGPALSALHDIVKRLINRDK